MSTTQIRGNTQIMSGTITTTQISSSAAITDGQLANGANYLKKDGSVAMTGSLDCGSNTVINVSSPSNPTDAANKQYVDTVAQGLSQKPTARVATTAGLAAYTYNNGTSGVGATLTGNANNTQTSIDGVTYSAGDVVLIKNETAGSAKYNGLYTVTQVPDSSHPFIFTRHTSMDQSTEFNGAFVPVDNEGSTNANTLWLCNNVEGGVTVGTTAITFVQLTASTSYSAGNGLSLSTTTFSVLADSTGGSNLAKAVNVSSNGVAVKVDGTTIAGNGSNQLGVVNAGIGPTQLAAQASGTGLTGGNGSNLAIQRSTRETPSGSINGSNTTFTLANTPVSGTEEVFLNGILQEPGAGNDYTISGNTITYLTAPNSSDRLRVSYFY